MRLGDGSDEAEVRRQAACDDGGGGASVGWVIWRPTPQRAVGDDQVVLIEQHKRPRGPTVACTSASAFRARRAAERRAPPWPTRSRHRAAPQRRSSSPSRSAGASPAAAGDGPPSRRRRRACGEDGARATTTSFGAARDGSEGGAEEEVEEVSRAPEQGGGLAPSYAGLEHARISEWSCRAVADPQRQLRARRWERLSPSAASGRRAAVRGAETPAPAAPCAAVADAMRRSSLVDPGARRAAEPSAHGAAIGWSSSAVRS